MNRDGSKRVPRFAHR